MRVFVIAGLTFKEALRRRVLLLGFGLTLLFLALYGTGVHYAFASIGNSNPNDLPGGAGAVQSFRQFEAMLFLSMGLFVANMAGALVAAFTSCGAIATEVEQGTLQTLVTRPITRRQIVFGKWLGHAGLLAIYLAALFASIVLIVYSQSGWLPENLFAAAAAFILETLVVLSVAIVGSSFLPTVANAVVVVMLFMSGMIGGVMEQVGVAIGKKGLFTTGIISSIIMPTDSLYRYTVHLLKPAPGSLASLLPSGVTDMGPFGAASPPSIWMVVYAVVFCVIMVTAAAIVFDRRDL